MRTLKIWFSSIKKNYWFKFDSLLDKGAHSIAIALTNANQDEKIDMTIIMKSLL